MFTSEFNQVYREAFISGAGRDLDAPDVVAEQNVYIPKAQEALIEHWTRPGARHDRAISDISYDRNAMVFRIQHPNTAEFDESDAEDIARIRFLGHAIIETSKRTAPEYDENDQDRGLTYSDWLSEHEGEEIPDDRAHDSDAPSPLRLASWPRGDYINCLGISIAVAGQEARAESPFYYINRLRHAGYDKENRTVELFNRIFDMNPDLYHAMIATFQIAGGANSKEADSMADGFRGIQLSVGEVEMDDSFHHSVLSQRASSMFDDWIQVDPYALVVDAPSPYPVAKRLASMLKTTDAGRANEVILFDSDLMDYSFASVMAVVKDSEKIASRFFKSVNGNYKSDNYFSDVRERFVEYKEALWFRGFCYRNEDGMDYSGDEWIEMSRKSGLNADHEVANAHWLYMLLATRLSFYDNGEYELKDKIGRDAINDLFAKGGKMNFSGPERQEILMKHIEIIENSLKRDMTHNKAMQENFKMKMDVVPALFCFEELFRTLKIHGAGTSDQAMEITDPDFMVGAMYLNHYATWRKDGKVNVAKELSRLSPSQLLWQAAVSREPDAINDHRVRSVGRLVASLKNDQLHPLVRITLPTVKEQDAEEKNDGRKGRR